MNFCRKGSAFTIRKGIFPLTLTPCHCERSVAIYFACRKKKESLRFPIILLNLSAYQFV